MQALVIGHGSIGSRHAAILSGLGVSVSLVTAQKIENYPCYQSIEEALKKSAVDQIIIANATYLHHESLQKILTLNFQGTILVEKPLFSQIETLDHANNKSIYVTYNLRFHELFSHLKKWLTDDELVSFSVNVGSYLPHWRKNGDYRDCYSAKKEWGGGVLRDLSHELDYITWLCGQCIEVTAIGGHFSTLEINSDDVYSILMRCEKCPVVSVQLDYLNRMPIRKIIIHTKKQNTLFIDLLEGTLTVNGEVKCHVIDGIQNTFVAQHQKAMQNNFNDFCTYAHGLSVMKLIESIELAAFQKKWIVI